MDKGMVCQECNKPIPEDAPGGHCPNCLLDLGSHLLCNRWTPRRFGDYELLEPIGQGAMGVVYKARQLSLNRLVALKMLSPLGSAFPALAQRIRIEAEAAASLNHPHIVKVIDAGESEGQPFFTMELVQGVGMDTLIGSKGFCFSGNIAVPGKRHGAPAIAVSVMLRIAQAVEHAHKHGVLHRDLKPGNIVIDADGEPHLTDFGLAKILAQEKKFPSVSGAVIGTASFMSPEQARGEGKNATTATDVYGLGAILYAMLTGQSPFRGDTWHQTLNMVIHKEPKHLSLLNDAVDQDLATICLKCLEKQPEQRYSSAQALAEDLQRWLRQEPIEARPVRFLGRAWRWCRREPVLAGLTGGLVLLLAATALLAFTLYTAEKKKFEESERQKETALRAIFNRISTNWNQHVSVRIYAQDVALLSNRSFAPDGDEKPVVLGIHETLATVNINRAIYSYAPLVNHLQTHQPAQADMRVLFELQIYGANYNPLDALTRGEVDLMPLDPALYVLLRQLDPTVRPLVQEVFDGQSPLEGAIFTRADSPFNSLEDLRGYSFAFGTTNTALGDYLPKAAFVEAGLSVRDFQHSTNIWPSQAVIAAVRKGHYAAGVADLVEVRRFMKLSTNFAPQLKILATLPCPGPPWVATTKIDDANLAPLIQRLLESARDPQVLAAKDPTLRGFRKANPADYNELKERMEKARQFDREDKK